MKKESPVLRVQGVYRCGAVASVDTVIDLFHFTLFYWFSLTHDFKPQSALKIALSILWATSGKLVYIVLIVLKACVKHEKEKKNS